MDRRRHDQPDTGLHHSAMPQVTEALADAARDPSTRPQRNASPGAQCARTIEPPGRRTPRNSPAASEPRLLADPRCKRPRRPSRSFGTPRAPHGPTPPSIHSGAATARNAKSSRPRRPTAAMNPEPAARPRRNSRRDPGIPPVAPPTRAQRQQGCPVDRRLPLETDPQACMLQTPARPAQGSCAESPHSS